VIDEELGKIRNGELLEWKRAIERRSIDVGEFEDRHIASPRGLAANRPAQVRDLLSRAARQRKRRHELEVAGPVAQLTRDDVVFGVRGHALLDLPG
jgi:hypothetical protein